MSRTLATATTVGERCYLARTRAGHHNAKAFYESIGLNRDRMSRVERGIEEARFSDLAAISVRTGVSVEWLQGEQEAFLRWMDEVARTSPRRRCSDTRP
jgi:hypothetical protein